MQTEILAENRNFRPKVEILNKNRYIKTLTKGCGHKDSQIEGGLTKLKAKHEIETRIITLHIRDTTVRIRAKNLRIRIHI